MTLSTDLPTGLYLISSFTDKHFHAGRIPVSAPSHYVWTYPYRDSRTVRLPGSASQEETFYYSSDSTADFAFLEDIDGDSPWALAARAREDAKKNGTLSAPSSPGSDRGDSGASTLFDINEDSAPSTPPSPLSDLCMTPPLTDVKSTTDLYGLETRLEKAVSQAQKQATDGVFSTFVGAGEEAPEWLLEKLPDGRYTLSTFGTPTAVQKGLLQACTDTVKAEQWELVPRLVQGQAATLELAYTIEWAGGGAGWVRPARPVSEGGHGGDDGVPIVIGPLPNQPPQEALWTITALSI